MKPTTPYNQFLTNKVIIAESFGFEVPEAAINPLLKPHNKSVALWALAGGRRAIFLNFGLHKSFTQLEIATQCINKYQRPFLIACPLAVAGEFKRDAAKFGIPYKVTNITKENHISLERFTQINAEIEALERTLQALENDYANRWYLMGKITVTTDVVSENNQTYRLTWGEQCKDATKMGAGLPEYILLFRKAPTSANNAYADESVTKTKEEYTLPIWQLDAHAYWRSNGNRFLTPEEMQRLDVKTIYRAWQKHNTDNVYTYAQHLKACNDLDAADKLSRLFMSLPVHSNSEFVWTDINRMNTLNAKQVNSKKEKHICPLQIDIIRRLIHRFTNAGQTVYDPFGGLFSTAYVALEMGRKAVSVELNPEYFIDGVCHVKAMDYKLNVPTLFDLLGAGEPANELLVNEEKAA